MELLATARAKAWGRMCCLSGGTDTRISCTAFRKFSGGWHVIRHTMKWSARPPWGHSRNAPAQPGCSGGRGPLAVQGAAGCRPAEPAQSLWLAACHVHVSDQPPACGLPASLARKPSCSSQPWEHKGREQPWLGSHVPAPACSSAGTC